MATKQVSKKVPETPLPRAAKNQTAADHAQISKRFREHTDIEVEAGNRLQAGEKIWASVAHALKAVAAKRGWEHRSHGLLSNIALQLGRERGEFQSYREHLDSANAMHTNFYQNEDDWDSIELAQKKAGAFIAKLKEDRERPPRPVTIIDGNDQRRLANLLGMRIPRDPSKAKKFLDERLPKGTRSPEGFSPKYGYKKPSKPRQHKPRAPKPNLRSSTATRLPGLTVRRRRRR